MLNTAVAESLRQYADELEQTGEDFEAALHRLIRRVIREHKRILFNGNGYTEEWVQEAAARGLLNLPTTPDAVPAYLAEKNVSLFTRHQVFTREELSARHDMKLDLYNKVIHIEAATMISMLRKDILPAVSRFSGTLAENGSRKASFCPGADTSYESSTVMRLSSLLTDAANATQILENDLAVSDRLSEVTELAVFCRDRILPDMNTLRALADTMETITDKEAWPYPSYGDLLFSVN